jgi:hypothetical protein
MGTSTTKLSVTISGREARRAMIDAMLSSLGIKMPANIDPLEGYYDYSEARKGIYKHGWTVDDIHEEIERMGED